MSGVRVLDIRAVIEDWDDEYENEGLEVATLRLLQLSSHRLALTCTNQANPGDFNIPDDTDLDNFDFLDFIKTASDSKTFDTDLQRKCGDELAKVVLILLEKSLDLSWVPFVEQFFGAIFSTFETNHFAMQTILEMFFGAMPLKLHDSCEYISNLFTVRPLPFDEIAMVTMVDGFFRNIVKRPISLQQEPNGCQRFIEACLSLPPEGSQHAIEEIIRIIQRRVVGDLLLPLLTEREIVDELCRLVCKEHSIRLVNLGINLACRIQESAVQRNLFNMDIFRNFIDNEKKSFHPELVRLCLLSLREPNSTRTYPMNVIIFVTRVHRKFAFDRVTCPKTLASLFLEEFSNWNQLSQAIRLIANDTDHACELFKILISAFRLIKNSPNAEDEMRSAQHTIIDFIHARPNCDVKVFDSAISAILAAEKSLKLVDNGHLNKLVAFIENPPVDFSQDFTHYRNYVLMMSHLIRKGFIGAGFLRDIYNECMNGIQHVTNTMNQHPDNDIDKDPNAISHFMKLCALTFHTKVYEFGTGVFAPAYHILANTQLVRDLSKNRHFLGYNLITFVQCNFERRIPFSAQLEQITKILLEILQNTQEDIDFLSAATFWCIGYIELFYKGVSRVLDVKLVEKSLVTKLTLMSDDHDEVFYTQLSHIDFMVESIAHMACARCDFELGELVAALHKKLYNYSYTFAFLKQCIRFDEQRKFAVCTMAALDTIPTKTEKTEFLKAVKELLTQKPNAVMFEAELLKIENQNHGRRIREGQTQSANKRMRGSVDALNTFMIRDTTN